jgi:hypothetical protein
VPDVIPQKFNPFPPLALKSRALWDDGIDCANLAGIDVGSLSGIEWLLQVRAVAVLIAAARSRELAN